MSFTPHVCHELKTDPSVFVESLRGDKNFEIRYNNRDYRVGDTLLLRETIFSGEDMRDKGKPLMYTGRVVSRQITSVVTGYGLQGGWVALGVRAI